MIISNGKIYEVCDACGEIVRTNKPLLGSVHICVTAEEQREFRVAIAHKAAANRAALRDAGGRG